MSAQVEPNMHFIRLFFPVRVEEEIALRWANRLGRLLGNQALALRPETTLGELINWADALQTDSFSFICVFEPELRDQLGDFLEIPEAYSFRDMVHHIASRYPEEDRADVPGARGHL